MQEFEIFNSGVMELCKLTGNTITETIGNFRFGDKTVGVTRFYQAKVAATQIERLISIPRNKMISKNNVVIIDGVQYEIEQIQYKEDTFPKTTLLTLSEMAVRKKDGRL